MAFVRPYQQNDEDAIIHIFRETASPELRQDPNPDTLHIASFLWARPYINLRPDWCLVLDDGQGLAVGYIICAPDTASFVQDYRQKFIPYSIESGIIQPTEEISDKDLATSLRHLVFRPEDMLHEDFPSLLKDYPAHLHIDIRPGFQGGGHGAKLMKEMIEKLRAKGIPGLYVGKDAKNDRANNFYDRLEFKAFPEMQQDGQPGKKGGAVYLVKKIGAI